MKNKFKKLLLTLTLSMALIIGSVSGLLLPLSNVNSAFAEYTPTNVNTYDFNSTTGWTTYRSSNTQLVGAFDGSSASIKKTDSAFIAIDEANKPAKLYDNETDLTDSDAFMMFHAKNAPLKTEINKTDEDGKFIYKEEYEKDNDSVDKIYTSIPADDDASAFVAVDENDLEQGYKRKVNETEFVNSYYSYKTSSSISLSKNSYYVISAYVWTKNAAVSMYAQDANKTFNANYEVVSSDGTWKEIYIFVETATEDAVSAYLYFYYYSEAGLSEEVVNDPETTDTQTDEGFVYVDHVVVQKISETEFNNKTIAGKNIATANSQIYSARYDYDMSAMLENSDFQSELDFYSNMYGQDEFVSADANNKYQRYINKYTSDDSTTKLTNNQLNNVYHAYGDKFTYAIVSEAEEFKTVDEDEHEIPAKDTFQSENKVLKLKNTSEKYTLGLLSPTITVEQFGFYKLSLWVKASETKAEATIKLVSYIKDGNSMTLTDVEDGKMIIKSQSVTEFSKTDDFTNDWVEVSFYIQANVYHEASFQIALLANPGSTVYFDNIRINSVTSTAYSNATSSAKFDLSPSTLLINNGITNGYFNFIKTEKNAHIEDIAAPYTPANWTELSNNDKGVTAGIVSTIDENYNTAKTNIGNATNPLATQDDHGVSYPRTNVLAVYAPNDVPSKTYNFGYKSVSFALSSSSVYKITFEALASDTPGCNFSGKIAANLVYSDSTIASIESQITTYGIWQVYTIVVRTGDTSRSCTLELSVKDAQGTVFFQKVGYTQLASKTVDGNTISVDEQYSSLLKENNSVSAQNANNIKFVDFAGDLTSVHSIAKATDKDYYEANGYVVSEVAEGKTKGEIGVIDTSENTLYDGSEILNQSFTYNENVNGNLALLIYNKNDSATKVAPKYKSTLSSSSYYEISVYVKTANVADTNGLTIKMDKISVEFTNINTGAINDAENEYVKYTAYVKTGTSSISEFEIDFVLGTEDNQFSGVALVSGTSIKKFANATEYNDAIKEVEGTDTTTIIKDFSSSESESSSSNEEKTADNFTLATLFLVLSSILLAVALIIALIAVLVKRMPKHKKVNVPTRTIAKSRGKDSDKDTSNHGFV